MDVGKGGKKYRDGTRMRRFFFYVWSTRTVFTLGSGPTSEVTLGTASKEC